MTTVFHTGPVTALACMDGTILAGIGSRLHIYLLHPSVQHTGTYSILPGRVVHGIRQESSNGSEEYRLCLFGQKCLRVIQFEPRSCEVMVNTGMVEFSDWIWDVAWLQGGERLCLALGHNVITVWDIVNRCIARTTHCAEKCILYCAKFLTCSEDCLVLAAGTVFNQVVLWSLGSESDPQGCIEPFHRLTGHQGVIFSVDYDPVSQRICSVSDDRSVRLYQATFPQTEFDCSLTNWENMETSLLHVLYGHSARVWDVRLMSNSFVSVGEDATCCVWNYDGKVIQKYKGHKGKSIWSMAVDRQEQFVVTGGGDNSIRLWKLQSEQTDVHVSSQVLHLQISPKDFPRSVQFLSDVLAVVMTNEGSLLQIDVISNTSSCIINDEEFASYSVLSASTNKHMVAIGNIHGTLRILYWHYDVLHKPEIVDSVIYNGRVFSIIWLDDDHLLTSGPNGEMNVCRIPDPKVNRLLQHLARFELPTSKHRWASAAAFSQDMLYVICGDRAGSVMLYNMDDKLVQMFPRIHKADVTHVCLHGNQVYTTGRDGIYRLYEWGEDQLVLLNSSKVYKGFVWIERLTITEDGDMLIQGFNANKFIVWSVQQNQKLIEVESGGGHRSWDFLHNGCHGSQAKLLYIKAREVIVKEIRLKSHQLVVKGCLHGRELCDVRHIASSQDTSGRPIHLLATCSEDTMVCLSSVYYNMHNQQDMHMLHSLSGHISSVRCLAICESGVPCSHNSILNRKLLFSAGGRAQIKIWRLDDSTSEHSEALTHKCLVKSNTSCISETSDQRQNIKQTICSHVADDSNITPSSSVIQNTICDSKNITHSKSESSATMDQNDRKNSSGRENADNLLTNLEQENGICTSDEASKIIANSICDSNTSGINPGDLALGCEDCASAELDSNPKVDEKSNSTLLHSCQYESLAGVQLGGHKKRKGKPWRLKEDNSDPETRILDMTVFRAQDLSLDYGHHLYFVTAACSDGLIRFFLFEEDSREVTLIASSDFHDHCVLKVAHVIHISEQTTTALILSAATDGRVAFWDVTELCRAVVNDVNAFRRDNKESSSDISVFLEKKVQSQHTLNSNKMGCGPKSSDIEEQNDIQSDVSDFKSDEKRIERSGLVPFGWLNCHQSGVNGVFFGHYEVPDQYILVTGGDDNALHVHLIAAEELVVRETEIPSKVKVISSGSEFSAHAAQITGVWYLGKNLIVTASIGQRICIWSFIAQESLLKLELKNCKFVDVPDIANVDVWRQGEKLFIAVCGEGLEILEIDTDS